MNILIPDQWLREYLKTKATPEQIKEYLSLCGPSVERITKVADEIVYDIEITTNRPDSMSVIGIAREAAAILPRFNISAKFTNDPYKLNTDNYILRASGASREVTLKSSKPLSIKTNPVLNPRWTSVVLTNVTVKDSPVWLKKYLELTGIRPLNNVIDITNYLMRAYGQPAHAFDYDRIGKNKNKIPVMLLRESKKGERLTTLDGKTHTLPGHDIVIENGNGTLIDLCGIMGAENSSIKDATTSVVLFMQTYDPGHIRKTSMALAHRTEAATLFEKGLDPELVLPTIHKGIELMQELANAQVASPVYDVYDSKYEPVNVTVSKEKLITYLGTSLPDIEVIDILQSLQLEAKLSKTEITVKIPSFRRDIAIDVDIIEEVARIYGYHRIVATLPASAPPSTTVDPTFFWEEEVKVRLRDWGFTETYTYSMISDELMDLFNLNKQNAYKIANPLSSEWVYMRPALIPSLLVNTKQNLNIRADFKIFELSNIYKYRKNELPEETPILAIVLTGERFYETKGVAERLFELFGIPNKPTVIDELKYPEWNLDRSVQFNEFGVCGEIKTDLLQKLGIKIPICVLELNFAKLVEKVNQVKRYTPISKFPPVIEDLSFTVPAQTPVGELMNSISAVSDKIHAVQFLNKFENTVSVRMEYLNPVQPLTPEEVNTLRQQIIEVVERSFHAQLKGGN